METYEIRLFNNHGQTSLIYKTMCVSDEHAKETLERIEAPYTRFQIWRGMTRIAEGWRIAA